MGESALSRNIIDEPAAVEPAPQRAAEVQAALADVNSGKVQEFILKRLGFVGLAHDVEADDIVQEVVLKFVQYVNNHDVDFSRGWKPLLLRIIDTFVINKRGSKAWRERSHEELDEKSASSLSAHADPEKHLGDKEVTMILRNAVSRLDEPLREVAALLLEGKKQDEIAALLGKAKSIISRRVKAAKAALKDILEDEGVELDDVVDLSAVSF